MLVLERECAAPARATSCTLDDHIAQRETAGSPACQIDRLTLKQHSAMLIVRGGFQVTQHARERIVARAARLADGAAETQRERKRAPNHRALCIRTAHGIEADAGGSPHR